MNVVLLRVGIDTGSGGIYGPLFQDGSFEFIPIPDGWEVDERTYGNVVGRKGIPLIEYFPVSRRTKMQDRSMHVDPEFQTFTYGDPTTLKARLRHLEPGDLLVFYCGLKGWEFNSDRGLYICGYFEVRTAGYATGYSESELLELYSENFHVRHPRIFADQRDRLVLVKGTGESRLLDEAVLISEDGRNSAGRTLKILSEEMCAIFGDFDGKRSIQRSGPRWVHEAHVERAAHFVRSLN